MSKLIAESFDMWPSMAAMTPKWMGTPTGLFINGNETQFKTGRGVKLFVGSINFPSNEQTIYGCIRIKFDTATENAASLISFLFNDVANNQCCLQFAGNGSIVVRTGGVAGSIISTTTSAFFLNQWVSFQFKIVISSTDGVVQIRKDGSLVNLVDLSSQDTRGGSANDYANRLSISGTSLWLLDDVLLINEDGTAPSGWLGDVRCAPQLVANTTQAQFTQVTPVTRTGVVAVTTSQAVLANTFYARNYTVPRHALVANGTVHFNSAATGNYVMALYDQNANDSPGNLIVQSDVLVNPSSGNNIFNFGSNTQLHANQMVWIALYGSNSFTVSCQGNSVTQKYSNLFDYSNTAPAYAPDNLPNSLTVRAVTMSIGYVSNNSSAVSEPAYDSDTSYVYSSSVGAQDIYQMAPLGPAPANIVAVNYYTVLRKTDAGARSFEFIVDHGGTSIVVSNSSSLGTAYNIYESFLTKQTDNTSPLTVDSLNSALIGPKVSA